MSHWVKPLRLLLTRERQALAGRKPRWAMQDEEQVKKNTEEEEKEEDRREGEE